jgi:hypothetical protein
LDYGRIAKCEPTVQLSVILSATQRIAVHDPEKQRSIQTLSFRPRLHQVAAPGNLQPFILFASGDNGRDTRFNIGRARRRCDRQQCSQTWLQADLAKNAATITELDAGMIEKAKVITNGVTFTNEDFE